MPSSVSFSRLTSSITRPRTQPAPLHHFTRSPLHRHPHLRPRSSPQFACDLLFVEVRLPDGDGTDLLKAVAARAQRPLVVIITGFGSVESAVDCMRNGAFDYLIKPFSPDQIDFVLKKAAEYAHLVKVNRLLSQDPEDTGSELLGQSPAMEKLRTLLRRVARTDATVLIQGESGTGKELVARTLYRESPRNTGAFITLNCAAVPENLIESEFFGHEKGAFTGALNKREGRFELAHGGTLLLDEISEISPVVQAKLLRVLQEREFERVGGTRTIKVDVRVLATTNRQLEQSVARKEFRQDLFFRLNVVPIHVPPLRDRREDVAYLARHFLQRFARKHGVRVTGLSDACLQALHHHDWPGNVRELQNVIERAVILCDDSAVLEPDHLTLTPPRPSDTPSAPPPPSPAPAQDPVAPAPDAPPLTLGELERQHILAVLARCQNNRTQAARLLDISIRTLRNKLHEYNRPPAPSAAPPPLAAPPAA
ncbi:MAG: sigma-54-dependent Fis family transcriptional regulator [Verrucomicrobiales bacterium]|nr:sigma-54-dependent Fis family transcriptional regulator [Verrucomicrobiales bacterium]